ncbi:MAG: hypothetical protein J2P21_08105 [Chloracidobacterium sp.]|nr:hypothetical protein [Chloracidobacterium sp.]
MGIQPLQHLEQDRLLRKLRHRFGQPTGKANPNFGIGGPRIFQIGGRIMF